MGCFSSCINQWVIVCPLKLCNIDSCFLCYMLEATIFLTTISKLSKELLSALGSKIKILTIFHCHYLRIRFAPYLFRCESYRTGVLEILKAVNVIIEIAASTQSSTWQNTHIWSTFLTIIIMISVKPVLKLEINYFIYNVRKVQMKCVCLLKFMMTV